MPATSAWRVDGTRGGARRSYWGIGRMRDLTGVPLALGALLLDAHGVRAEAVT